MKFPEPVSRLSFSIPLINPVSGLVPSVPRKHSGGSDGEPVQLNAVLLLYVVVVDGIELSIIVPIWLTKFPKGLSYESLGNLFSDYY